jgi:hypothetical protein
MGTIQAQIIIVNDLQARRISAAENLQREDLSAIESIGAIAEIVDAELIEDIEYLSMGERPAGRVKALLAKLDSVRRSKELGYEVASEAKYTSHKFMGSVEKIFKNLPKPLEWRSFYNNDLPLLMDFCEEVQEVSIQHHLNKSQTRALAKLKETSEEEFQRIVTPVCRVEHSTGRQDETPALSGFDQVDQDFHKTYISDLNAREIEEIADKAAKKEALIERNRPRRSPSLSLEAKILLMNRLGIPVDRIAARLKVNRKTAYNYSDNPRLVQSIRDLLEKGVSVPEVAKKHDCPEPMVRSLALEGKSDQERFESLNWGLRTWDYWYFNDVDRRFGDDWPGRIPAQLVAHTLFYFTQEGDLVFDPMAGGGVVPDTCLAFNRKCWSFDLVDRPETRPEIEVFRWTPQDLLWPVKGKEKPGIFWILPRVFPFSRRTLENQGTHCLPQC